MLREWESFPACMYIHVLGYWQSARLLEGRNAWEGRVLLDGAQPCTLNAQAAMRTQ